MNKKEKNKRLRDIALYLRMFMRDTPYDGLLLAFEGPKEERVIRTHFQWVTHDELYAFQTTITSDLLFDVSIPPKQVAEIIGGIGTRALDRTKQKVLYEN